MGTQEELRFSTFESFRGWLHEKTANHPFKTGRNRGGFRDDFAQEKVPIDFLKEYAKQYYI